MGLKLAMLGCLYLAAVLCMAGCTKSGRGEQAGAPAGAAEALPVPEPGPTTPPLLPRPESQPAPLAASPRVAESTEAWCSTEAAGRLGAAVLKSGPHAGRAVADAVRAEVAGRAGAAPDASIDFTFEGTVVLGADGKAHGMGCFVKMCPRGEGIPAASDCYEWRLGEDGTIEARSDSSDVVAGDTTWAEMDQERAEEAWCTGAALDLAKAHRLRSGLALEKAIRRYVIETAVERLGRPDSLEMPRDLLLYGELVEAGQNALEIEWKLEWRYEAGCHVLATPRLEGEDVAGRMWGMALDWKIAREGDGYAMDPADEYTRRVGR